MPLFKPRSKRTDFGDLWLGNAPTDRCFLEKIKASQRHHHINVTQCQGGTVEMGRYRDQQGVIKLRRFQVDMTSRWKLLSANDVSAEKLP